jgi:ParB-like chromosome segregation protein Spo0J
MLDRNQTVEDTIETVLPPDWTYTPIIAKLREWNLVYEIVPDFPLSRVRRDEQSQVRQLSHIAPALRVEEYAQQMRNGAMFPPILLMRPDVLIDGNTRLKAAQRIGRQSFPAIVVDTKTRDMAVILAASLNQMGGERLTPEEAHEAALLMMRSNYPDMAIARELGRDISQVRRWRIQRDVQNRAESLGLAEQLQHIPRGSLGALASLTHEEPFVQTARLLAEVRPPEKQAKEMIAEIQQAPSDQAALAVVARMRDDLAPAGPPPRASTRKELPLVRAAIATVVKHEANLDTVINRSENERAAELARWTKLQQVVARALRYIESGEL